MAIVKKSHLLSADEAYKLISPVIIKMVDEIEQDPRVDESVASKLGFVPFEAITKGGQIQTRLGTTGVPEVSEFDSFTLDEDKYGPKISYDVTRVFPAEGMSSEAKKWIERAGQLNDIPEELKKDLASSLNKMSRRMASIRITENEYLTKCYTEGFSITAPYGYGSAVYDGKALFASDHVIQATGATYSNIVDEGLSETGTLNNKHAPLTINSLKRAVKMLREMKDGNGIRVKRPKSGIYDLIVSPELEETALNILSDLNGFAPYKFDGSEAGNDNYGNVFMRDGFKVRLVVLETMNQPDSKNPAVNIGSDTMWFLLNREGAINRGAFLNVKFGETSVEIFYDERTRATFITAEKHFGAQPLYPEVVVSSKGDSSTY